MFPDSIKYLEQMQQPFYVKYLTVSNHYPYTPHSQAMKKEQGFPLAEQKMRQSTDILQQLTILTQQSKTSLITLRKPVFTTTRLLSCTVTTMVFQIHEANNLAELLGKNPETWSNYDKAMLQRVPYMIHIPGYTGGGISNTFGGEVDALPTLLHILGVDTSSYIQMGQDLLSLITNCRI